MELCTDIFSSSCPIELNLSSILKEISPEYSLEGLMLKLKVQYFGHLMLRTDSLEKTLMLGKIEGRRRRGQQKMRWLDAINNLMDMSLSKSGSWGWTGKPGVLQSMGSQRVRHNWVTELSRYTYQRGSRTSLVLAPRRVQVCLLFLFLCIGCKICGCQLELLSWRSQNWRMWASIPLPLTC